MNPSVAIVILNWNGKKFLQQFLPSVLSSGYPLMQVIVVDNASTDDSVEFLKSQWPALRIIRHPVNYGFAKGYNEGLKEVDADYYVLLNSDVEVTPGWIEPIIRLMQSDTNIAACQPKILQFANKSLFEYAGAAGGWLDHLGYPFARGRIFDFCEEDKGQYDSTMPVFWASGAALFIRSAVFHEMRGFDEYFFAHQEEIDLCWRMHLAGYHIYCCPQSVVYHVGAGTLAKENALKVWLNFRNNMIMLWKNLPHSQAIYKIPFRVLLNMVSAFKSLLSGQFTYFIAVARAHWSFGAWMVLHRKKSIFPPQKIGKLEGYFNGSIVWRHFVLGKKKFSEIVEKKT